jgi:excinuclease ABC subunit C
MDFEKKISAIPNSPGVYFFKDRQGHIIYIGKAARLKKRVQSHFAKLSSSFKANTLISSISDIDYIVTGSQEEALLYEAHLIKKHQPKFNVAHRDDKAYPLLKLTIGEEYPRLFITRRKKDDNALYFGPFTSSKLLKRALALMRKIFPLRTCAQLPKSKCLNYHLRQCLAPCVNKENKDIYWQLVKDVILFLEGDRKQLISRLNQRMNHYAANQEFERALSVRDQIKALIALTTPMEDRRGALLELKELLNLKGLPRKIEAFDISDYAGKEAVGSLVTFVNGEPQKINYRRFKIKFVKKIDDYAMMKEIINRRFKRLIEERQRKPDLVIIDGGRGHLSVVIEQLKEMSLLDIRVVAIAKEHEYLYTKENQEPIELFKFPKVLFLIQRIRDEAHRFAISYHHKLRLRQVHTSVLDQIPGIGEKRKRILLESFSSISKIRQAKPHELSKLPTIDEKTARRIIEYLNR